MKKNSALQTITVVFALFGLIVFGGISYGLLTNYDGMASMARIYWYLNTISLREISNQGMMQGAMRGMVESLNDPYSTYLSKEENEELRVKVKGSFSGIGIVFGPDKDKRIRVIAPIKNTPAAKAGLKSKDIITEINGESTKGMTVDEAQHLIRGENGTQVRLTVFRESAKKELEFKIIRQKINVPSVDSKMLTGDIGYLQITQFTNNTPTEFEANLRKLAEKDPKALVIDLRDDPGGDFDASITVADYLLDHGLIVKTANRVGDTEVSEAGPPGVDLPMAVLVNKGTASAAEILSGALKDNKAAFLVGEKTYGKGLVQTVIELPGKDALKITTNKYFTPNGTDINQIGITPDYSLSNPENGNKDLQLDKAVALLKEKIARE